MVSVAVAGFVSGRRSVGDSGAAWHCKALAKYIVAQGYNSLYGARVVQGLGIGGYACVFAPPPPPYPSSPPFPLSALPFSCALPPLLPWYLIETVPFRTSS